jgi:hypothetical protein
MLQRQGLPAFHPRRILATQRPGTALASNASISTRFSSDAKNPRPCIK